MNIKSERSVKYLIYSDLKRAGGGNLIVRLFSNASFSILFWYRIGNYLKKKRNILCKMFYPIIFIIHKHNTIKYGIQFPLSLEIGEGMLFAHFSGIVLGTRSIGKNCTFYQCTIVGGTHGKGIPIIGDNVVLFAGAKVVGKVTIGNNVVIGANSVVVSDIPDNAVVVGIPEEIVSYNASNITQYI